jgi:uncharacterized protein YtpQ (UPF0354 family)
MSEQMQQSEFPIDASLILPRIKSTGLSSELTEAGMPPDQFPVTEPLVGKLLVAYAFDLPQGFMMVRQQDLAQLNISQDRLRKLSLDNLKKQMPEITVQFHGESGEVRRVITGNHFEACTLLAPNFWAKIAEQTAGEVVAAAPTRDIVVFCSSESKPGLAALAVVANEMMRLESGYALSNELFVWRGGEWQVFEQQA